MGWTKKDTTRLCDQMRRQGRDDDEIADEIRHGSNCSPLAAYRMMSGWSQSEVAERYKEKSGLPLEQATLSRIELWPEGGKAPHASQIIALAEIYGTSPLRLLTPYGFDRLDRHEREILARLRTAQYGTDTLPSPKQPARKPFFTPTAVDHPTSERQVAMAAQRALRFAALAEGTNVGPETLAELSDEVQRIASVYPRSPLHHVLGDLIEAQNIAFVLLEGRQQPNQTKDLYMLAGLLSLMLAKASHDLGDPRAAMKQARTAYVCADNADHNGLRVRIRAQQSLMAYWAGWTSEASRYAQLGRDLATPHTGTAGVWLLAQSARTWAALGHGERASQDLDAATDLQDAAEHDDLDAFGGLMRFARCRQLYYGADTRIWIPGQEEAAEQAAIEAINAYEEAAAGQSDDWAYGDDAGARSDLAFVRATQGDADGAADALSQVLALPVDQRVAGVVASAMRVHGALRDSRFAGSRTANTLRQQIEGYGQASAAALTPGR
ncbi:helix-turn-helix domain-containing protein [Nocardiopsis mangrovi]|uniref:Helix-turn-helix domain-containing protein n=1 Tax=Nocardiopsis mangrovi TaxID=1179818 RepID=A0ABV9DWP0_9ACTN